MTYPNDPNGDPAGQSPPPQGPPGYGAPNPYGKPTPYTPYTAPVPPESPSTSGPYYSGPAELYSDPQQAQQYPPVSPYGQPGNPQQGYPPPGYPQAGYPQAGAAPQPQFPGAPGYAPPQYNLPPPSGGGGNNKLIIIGAVVAVIAILGVVLTVILVSGNDSGSSNDAAPSRSAAFNDNGQNTDTSDPSDNSDPTYGAGSGDIAFAIGPAIAVDGKIITVQTASGPVKLTYDSSTRFVSAQGTAQIPINVGDQIAARGVRRSDGVIVATTLVIT